MNVNIECVRDSIWISSISLDETVQVDAKLRLMCQVSRKKITNTYSHSWIIKCRSDRGPNNRELFRIV